MKDKLKINEVEYCKLFRPVTKDDFTKTNLDVKIDYEYLYEMLTTDMKIITHPGQFHADEVFAIALVMVARQAIINNSKHDPDRATKPTVAMLKSVIERRNIDKLPEDEMKDLYYYYLILDLKDGHFDHHHSNPQDRWFNNGKFIGVEPNEDQSLNAMATFGCLWSKIGKIFNVDGIDGKNVYDTFYKNFVLNIDQIDNNGPKKVSSPIGKLISNMNSYDSYEFARKYTMTEDDEGNGLTASFLDAIMTAISIIHAELVQTQSMFEAIKIAKKKCSEKYINGVSYLCIPKVGVNEEEPYVPLNVAEELGHNAIINLNPNVRDGSYRIIMTDSTKLAYADRIYNDREHIRGLQFMHPGRFLVTFDSKENLLRFVDNVGRYEQGIDYV